jgi:nucleoside-diphosphate-sugar epimerase
MSLRVLILGANGFIGSHLTRALLARTEHFVYGVDLHNSRLADLEGMNPRFVFRQFDFAVCTADTEDLVKDADIILPLAAIANPIRYAKEPLRVFELDFEANLKVVRLCVKHGKRLIFPSSSEVYGMAGDEMLDEAESRCIYGPIEKQRWIYAACKQLLDRVIYAYGKEGLNYTIFRPFNWIGPCLDDMSSEKEGCSRLFAQFIANMIHGKPLQIVDGGKQRRCFTYIDDGIDALLRIIEYSVLANRQIFNLGNPANDVSVRELADALIAKFSQPGILQFVSSSEYFGEGYQDIQRRTPSIVNAMALLGWEPKVSLDEAIDRTLEGLR